MLSNPSKVLFPSRKAGHFTPVEMGALLLSSSVRINSVSVYYLDKSKARTKPTIFKFNDKCDFS